MDLAWHSPDLFVAPATRGFVWKWNAWMDLKSVPFQRTSTQQEHGIYSAPIHQLCLIKNAYDFAICPWKSLAFA